MSTLFSNIVDWLLSNFDVVVSAILTAAGWLIGKGFQLVAAFYGWLSQFLPTEVQQAVTALHTSLQSGALQQAFRVTTFIIDELVGVDLVLKCVGMIAVTWAIARTIKFAILIVNRIWGNAS